MVGNGKSTNDRDEAGERREREERTSHRLQALPHNSRQVVSDEQRQQPQSRCSGRRERTQHTHSLTLQLRDPRPCFPCKVCSGPAVSPGSPSRSPVLQPCLSRHRRRCHPHHHHHAAAASRPGPSAGRRVRSCHTSPAAHPLPGQCLFGHYRVILAGYSELSSRTSDKRASGE